MKPRQKKYRVYYFVGCDEYGDGGKRKSANILAYSEQEAENIFKRMGYVYDSFGWVEEI